MNVRERFSDEGPRTDVGFAVLERRRANNKPTLSNQTDKQTKKTAMNNEWQMKINEEMKWGACEM